MLAGMPGNSNWDQLVGPPATPEQARARRRQQASQARWDLGLDLGGPPAPDARLLSRNTPTTSVRRLIC
jgi:hypothetical protein